MKIFKFGGASVKDADGVKNLLNVVNKKADKNTIIVVLRNPCFLPIFK